MRTSRGLLVGTQNSAATRPLEGWTGYGNTPLALPPKWGSKMSVVSDFEALGL